MAYCLYRCGLASAGFRPDDNRNVDVKEKGGDLDMGVDH